MSADTAPTTRVLVVDDEAGIVEFVATALRYEGFDVAVADDGRSALEQVTSFRPELVVLDVMLPDLDGFEVARRLVADGVRVPIIFLTARDGTEDKVRGLTLGGDDYVTKPFSLDELLARVRSVLRRTTNNSAMPVSSALSLTRMKRVSTAVMMPPRKSTSPVPIRLRTPSTSLMMRDTSAPLLLAS